MTCWGYMGYGFTITLRTICSSERVECNITHRGVHIGLGLGL